MILCTYVCTYILYLYVGLRISVCVFQCLYMYVCMCLCVSMYVLWYVGLGRNCYRWKGMVSSDSAPNSPNLLAFSTGVWSCPNLTPLEWTSPCLPALTSIRNVGTASKWFRQNGEREKEVDEHRLSHITRMKEIMQENPHVTK